MNFKIFYHRTHTLYVILVIVILIFEIFQIENKEKMYLIFRFMAFNEQYEDLFRSFQAKYDLRPGFQGDYDLRALFGDLVDDPSFVRDRVSF